MALAVPIRIKTEKAHNTENKVFLPVEDVNFHDLFDWSTRKIALATTCKPPTKTGTVRQQGLQQQNSDTSQLVSINFERSHFSVWAPQYMPQMKNAHMLEVPSTWAT